MRRSSLQSKCLNHVLKSERPGSYLLKLQGMFHLRLRQLEKSLLQSLNDAKGKILNDESVITTLETLKKEAAAVDTRRQNQPTKRTSIKFIFFLCNKEGQVASAHVDGVSAEQLESVTRPQARSNLAGTGRLVAVRITRAELPPCRTNPKPVSSSMHQLLLIQAFQLRRVIAAAHLFAPTVLGEHVMANAERELNFTACVGKEHIYTLRRCSAPSSGRLRYVPLGWAEKQEFNEFDLRIACDTLDNWIDATTMGRTNPSPEKVP
ncbi:hypothetical protein quinque_015981 [Culex quinquefasciatus]